ncbi:hypothetical protein BKA80DRAFT_260146 [Phyllosticta citrichinensis]
MANRQTRQTRQSQYNTMEQNATMTRTGNRFDSLPKESFDLRYWPSTIAPETPSSSPVRNYLLHDWPPYKTELPSDLKRVKLYFDADYKDMYPHPKILSVHIGTGETMLSDPVPPTRRLWNRFIHEHLSLVHYTLVKWQPDSNLPVEPHRDDDFFTRPRRSSVFGTDIPPVDDSMPIPPPFTDAPSKDDIMADYFKSLRREGKDSKASMRDRRQQTKDPKLTDDDSDGDGDVNMQNTANAKKMRKNAKRQRQMLKRNDRLAAKALEDANEMKAAERQGMQGMAEEMNDGSAGGEVNENKRNILDELLGRPYASNPLPLDLGHPATGANVLPVAETSLAEQFLLANAYPLDTQHPGTGANAFSVGPQPVALQGMVNNTEGLTDVFATGADFLPIDEEPVALQGWTNNTVGWTDGFFKPVNRHMDSPLSLRQKMLEAGKPEESDDDDMEAE